MTGENGGPIGHGWFLNPELANTPLIIMDPQRRGPQLNYAVGSQVDLLPTLLDILGIPLPFGQLYEGRSLYCLPADDNRVIYLNTYGQYGTVTSNLMVFADRKTDGKAATPLTTAYRISNEGSKSAFTQDRAEHGHRQIGAFDQFQESLLRNYSLYCDSVWRGIDKGSR